MDSNLITWRFQNFLTIATMIGVIYLIVTVARQVQMKRQRG